MQVHFDWPKLYASVLLERPVQEKLAQCAARLIEHDIRTEQRRAGEVLGSSGELARRYALGRETMLGAVRLLDDQGIARMRRGPGGGLTVLAGKLGRAPCRGRVCPYVWISVGPL